MNHLIKTSSLLVCLTGFLNCTSAPDRVNDHSNGKILVTTAEKQNADQTSISSSFTEGEPIEEVIIKNEVSPSPAKSNKEITTSPQVSPVDNQLETNSIAESNTIETFETIAESTTEPETTEVVSAAPSHSAFNALLKKYVSASGKVNYEGFKTEKSKLVAYTQMLSSTPPQSSWSKNDKLAYWINVYNAFTIKLILDKWPVNSIMDINGGKAWDLKVAKVGTKTYSLNEVENSVIRPTFKEPRIHFAVNCAAVSCPKLLNEAYEGSTLNAQLEKSSKYFVNNTSKNKLSATSVQISKIFEWYGDDFKAGGGIIAFLNKYSSVKINSNAKISYLEYKWPLNK